MTKQDAVVVQMPERELMLKINDQEYKLSFPTVGQFIDIEARKISYAANQYDGMLISTTTEAFRAKIMVDMAATYDILIPKLRKDLTVKSMFELDLIQIHPFLDAYIKQYLKWHKEWMEYIDQLKVDEEQAD